jgi:hypothetical protein
MLLLQLLQLASQMQLHASTDRSCGCSCIHRCHITAVPSLCCHKSGILPFCTAKLGMLLMQLLLLALVIHPHTLGWPITATILPSMLLLLLPLVVITLLLLLDPIPDPILATTWWRQITRILQALLRCCYCCQLAPRQLHQLHTWHTSSSIPLRSSSL